MRTDVPGAGESHVVVVIPCFDEAETIGQVIAELPSRIFGLARLEVLVVDDGSTDASGERAEAAGARVLRLNHVGLARAYLAGVQAAHRQGADFVVTLDADGQYDPAALPSLIESLKGGEADLVLVERGPDFLLRLGRGRRLLHRLGALVVRLSSGLPVADPVTGFRGYSRRAIERLEIQSRFTYTLESLIQAAAEKWSVATLVHPPRRTDRPSRLFKSPLVYAARQTVALVFALARHRLRARRVLPVIDSIEATIIVTARTAAK